MIIKKPYRGAQKMKGILNWLKTEESGQGMVEYGLIIAGIAIVVMGAIFLLGPKISTMFEDVGTQLDSATASSSPAS